MKLRVGLALASAVDSTNVIVIRAGDGEADLTCGGLPMVVRGAPPTGQEADPAFMQGTLIGKRYIDEGDRVEVLCTRPGPASLALDGRLLVTAEAKPLPSSD